MNPRPTAERRNLCVEKQDKDAEGEAGGAPASPSALELRHWFEDRLRNAISIAMGGDELRDDIPIMVTEAIAPARSIFDFQSSIAISLSGRGGGVQSPEAIAEGLLNNLQSERRLLEPVVELTGVSGRGFINFRLSAGYLAARLVNMFLSPKEGTRLGFPKVLTPERVVVDYASPNICKDLHVGHLRSAVVGDALANLLEFAGHRVVRQNHLGDFGCPAALVLGALEDAELRARPDVQALSAALREQQRRPSRRPEEDREEAEEAVERDGEGKGGAEGKGDGKGAAEALRSGDLQGEMQEPRPSAEGAYAHIDWTGIYQAAKAKVQQDAAFEQACDALLLRLQTAEETSALRQTWAALRRLSLERFESTYRLLGLRPQQVRGESFYAPLLPRVFHHLHSRGLLALRSGALCGVLPSSRAAADPLEGPDGGKEGRDDERRAAETSEKDSDEAGSSRHAAGGGRDLPEAPTKERETGERVKGRGGEAKEEGCEDSAANAKQEEACGLEATGKGRGRIDEIEPDLRDVVVLKKRGATVTYSATDLAAALHRSAYLQADRVLYVVDSAQASHFQRVFSLAHASGITSLNADLRRMRSLRNATGETPMDRAADGSEAENGNDAVWVRGVEGVRTGEAWGTRREDVQADDGVHGFRPEAKVHGTERVPLGVSQRDGEGAGVSAASDSEAREAVPVERSRPDGACAKRSFRDDALTELTHVAVGIVKNPAGTKMKSRAGSAPLLADLLRDAIRQAEGTLGRRTNECLHARTSDAADGPEGCRDKARILGIAAVKYAELSTRRDVDYVFSPDKMLSPKGNTAPYILYSLVRVKGILRRAGWTAGVPTELHGHNNLQSDIVYHLHQNGLDRQLAVRLLGFAMAVQDAIETLMPSKLTAYLYSLCLAFNAFYEKCEVTKAVDEGLRLTRLLLVHGVRQILETSLDLLGIQAVDTL
ncbi:putative arginyl-tRNA synthetase [Neospora caninum Liverpool]|uniref:arginine--tRNA ligase n=1 Tax=Neospora caninum (strain Liverpool) TaxID=572307 RepID=F0VIJ8_NEOCL|nr:putative arginyl-tRNA synthetase [Neospora caninum Liverpool]CBZ53559.1 putative arginyl-tRNA synthetase [Neospora caninum Liverpool]|eukprot:XP_003883591.1 putative arginyl-tRNA synthetase [Neospora caninum Liverpool]